MTFASALRGMQHRFLAPSANGGMHGVFANLNIVMPATLAFLSGRAPHSDHERAILLFELELRHVEDFSERFAGFGIREASQVAALAAHVDGVVVGSAVIEAMEKGASPAALLRQLRG